MADSLSITNPTEEQGTKMVTVSTAFNTFKSAISGLLQKSVAGSSNVTLTAVEAQNAVYEFTGVLTGNISVLVPPTTSNREFTVFNNTTGAFTLTVKTTAGGSTGIAVTQTKKRKLYHDGTNVLDPITESGTGAGVSDGDKGDITVSGSGATYTIDNDVVTYAKMQNVSAASKLLGRGDSGSGDVQEITLGSGLAMTGTTLSSSGGISGLTTNQISKAGSSTTIVDSVIAEATGGKIGINTTSPFRRFSINDASTAYLGVEIGDTATYAFGSEGNNNFIMYDEVAAAYRYVISGTNHAITGALAISGALSKGSGTFKIDHPLDPDNKFLYHGFIEGPRYDLIYRGQVKLSAGQAEVSIDLESNMMEGTFEALTQNPQVFVQNESGWEPVRGNVSGGTLTIRCKDNASNDDVGWMVVAERADDFIKTIDNVDAQGRMIPEVDKVDPTPEEIQRVQNDPGALDDRKGKRIHPRQQTKAAREAWAARRAAHNHRRKMGEDIPPFDEPAPN